MQHGYTSFAPHFMHHKCPAAAASTEECRANCINEGRYCAFDSISDELAASFQPRQVPALLVERLVAWTAATGHGDALGELLPSLLSPTWLLPCKACSQGAACTFGAEPVTAIHRLHGSHSELPRKSTNSGWDPVLPRASP